MDKPKLQPRLVVIEGKEKGKALSLRHGTSIIGRSKADIVIEDPRISRSHVALHFDERAGTLSFTDLKSLNNTLLNGQPAESGELKDGDRLQLGNTLLDCQLKPDAWETSLSISIRPPEPSAPPSEEPVSVSIAVRSEPAEEEKFDLEEPPQRKKTKEKPTVLSKHTDEEVFDEDLDGDSDESDIEKTHLQKVRDLYARLPRKARMWTWVGVLVVFLLWGMPSRNPTINSDWAAVENLEKQGKPDEAFALAEKIQKEQATDSKVQFKVAGYFERQGRYDAAIIAYGNAANATPSEPVAIVKLISLLLRSGRTDQAQAALGRLDDVLRQGPHSKELFVEAAQLFIENKQLKHSPEKALILARALQREFSPDTPIGYKLEAQVFFQEQKNDEALAAIEQGLKISPQDEWLLENLAFAKLSLKDVVGAEEVIKKWLESSPQNMKAQLVMAYLRFNEKDYQGALPYAQSILQTKQGNSEDPYFKEALFLTGQIYWAQGQTTEAGAFMRRACESGYDAGCKHEAFNLVEGGDRSTAAPAERAPADPPSDLTE